MTNPNILDHHTIDTILTGLLYLGGGGFYLAVALSIWDTVRHSWHVRNR